MSRKLAFVLAYALLPIIGACVPTGGGTEKPASLEPSM